MTSTVDDGLFFGGFGLLERYVRLTRTTLWESSCGSISSFGFFGPSEFGVIWSTQRDEGSGGEATVGWDGILLVGVNGLYTCSGDEVCGPQFALGLGRGCI